MNEKERERRRKIYVERTKEHQAETKSQLSQVYIDNKEFIEKQIDTGKTDWSLFSLVLGRVNFNDCDTSEDVLKKFYGSIFPYLGKLIRDNYNAKALLAKVGEYLEEDLPEVLSEEDVKIFQELLANKSDPLSMSHKVLAEEKAVARKRAKSPIIMPGQKGYRMPPKVR